MKNPLSVFLLVLAALCMPVTSAMGKGHVQVDLLANVSAIKPGQPFTLGVRFKIDPDWHIYWTNPGDSGLPTKVKLNLPAGFTADPVQYPVPAQLALPGDILNYAYEDEVMLLITVTPPKDLPTDKSVTVSGKAAWLVCKDNCIPGNGMVSLDLPVADTNKPDNTELFATWTNRLPIKADDANIAKLTNAIEQKSKADGDLATIVVDWKNTPSDVQYIPGALKTGDISAVKVVNEGDKTTITFRIKDVDTANEPVSGLLTYKTAEGVRVGLEVTSPAK